MGFEVSGRNYGLVPLLEQAMDKDTQLARLQDFMIADRDKEAAQRAREYYGAGVPIDNIADEDKAYFIGAAYARIHEVPNHPEAYWVGQKREIPEADRERLFELLGGELIKEACNRWETKKKLEALDYLAVGWAENPPYDYTIRQHTKNILGENWVKQYESSQSRTLLVQNLMQQVGLPSDCTWETYQKERLQHLTPLLKTRQKEEQTAKDIQVTEETKRNKLQRKRIFTMSAYIISVSIYLAILIKIITRLWNNRTTHTTIFPLICSGLLLLALCPMPYGYYTFLRSVITIWGAATAYQHLTIKPGHLGGLLAAGIAILYNPLIPIHLDKDLWTIINLISIPAILLITYLIAKRDTGTP